MSLDDDPRRLARSGRTEFWNEEIGLYFLKDGRVDPDRENTTVQAALRVGSASSENVADRVAWSSRIAAGEAEAVITRSAYSGPDIHQGDKIRALERHAQPWWEVLRVDDRERDSIRLKLGAA